MVAKELIMGIRVEKRIARSRAFLVTRFEDDMYSFANLGLSQ